MQILNHRLDTEKSELQQALNIQLQECHRLNQQVAILQSPASSTAVSLKKAQVTNNRGDAVEDKPLH